MWDGDDSGGVTEIDAEQAFKTRKITADLEEDGDEIHLGSDPPVASKLRLESSGTVTGPTTMIDSLSAESSTVSGNSGFQSDETLMQGTSTTVIKEFEKRGDGMNAYIVYKVVTNISGVPGYTQTHYEVWRRFSDFLGLHEKLVEKYLPKGVVLPSPPEKSIVALTRTKTSGETVGTNEVAVMRARLLQRYLQRLLMHPSTRVDCDVRDFLTMNMELPKSSNTSTLSSANVKKILKSVGDAFTKMAVHMEEGDRWFEQTQSQVDELEEGVHRMHTIAEGLAGTRKELKTVGDAFAKAISMLASCEESTALARVLSHCTETQEGIANAWELQAEADTAILVEGLAEYEALFTALKNVFAERHRVWYNWQNAQQNITRKREQKTRLELAGKTDKAAALRAETDEAIQKADELEMQFARLSDTIRGEVARFDGVRKKEMKQMLIAFLESVIVTQTEMLKLWQKFAPEAEAIVI